ncbi:hypothetical protein P8T80_08060 [Corynebacterium rouxii]|uniref:Transposase n=1 Tax=Corynebacterium rouxii TaxID=2719119 RepID=A0ABU3PND8_9CORY|nr:hypothetical protein [Corynebacterium rouxii]MDT9411331.1 hypothetical protein [Corynebacterium rouxii]
MASWKRRLAVIALLADNHISLSPVLVDAVAGLLKSLEKDTTTQEKHHPCQHPRHPSTPSTTAVTPRLDLPRAWDKHGKPTASL